MTTPQPFSRAWLTASSPRWWLGIALLAGFLLGLLVRG